jgi:hypothetical protein
MNKWIIKNPQGKTVIKTSYPAIAAQYTDKPGYRVLSVPVTR